ncbi:OST-HTH/LOTUS domain-containing protein [Salinihabitans flavidus]|uniref:OST-HTH/LOTUS domain-containing protein n=1 Tax=Salinihabitans flavidus TaxID=569882 RepID=A0A1H8LI72_9RHOB|nr:NYN domain-containing protein [Salinihabitans flavidus]SEO04496.1 OST-HTH/LOTUS domain-containing protein [Salinihabitans flavidus]
MPEGTTPLLAVLIDADNVPARHAEAIFEEIASLGEASIRRIYGDFSGGTTQGWSKDRLASLALVPHQQFANTIGKNASDIALVIDAMDILHSGRFDGFVLVSSDSDFTRLASRIREQGLEVYGIGERKTPEAFRKACKRFIFVENLVGEEAVEKPGAEVKKISPSKAVPLITMAMRAIDQEAEWYSLGPLGQFITTANPDFDTRTYGCPNLSTLIRKSGKFEIKTVDGVLKARAL